MVIEYEPLDKEAFTQFRSTVYYHKKTASEGSKPSTVKGTETLTRGYEALKDLADLRTNGATFDWKGAGWLFFVGSHWEVLGYGKDPQTGLEWAVTCKSMSWAH